MKYGLFLRKPVRVKNLERKKKMKKFLVITRRFVVYSRKYLVISKRFLVITRWFLVYSGKYLVISKRFLVITRWFLVYSRKYLVISKRSLVITKWFLVYSRKYRVISSPEPKAHNVSLQYTSGPSSVRRRRPPFPTWISLKPVGQSWSNFMCSITGVGERLHNVLGQIGSKLWCPWQQKAPIDL